jgi:hypothetical protein
MDEEVKNWLGVNGFWRLNSPDYWTHPIRDSAVWIGFDSKSWYATASKISAGNQFNTIRELEAILNPEQASQENLNYLEMFL